MNHRNLTLEKCAVTHDWPSYLNEMRGLSRDVSFLKTLYWNYRCGLRPFSMLVYPNTYVHISSTGKVMQKAGKLRLGCRWSVGPFKPSELIIGDNATLEVDGELQCFTGSSIVIDAGAVLSIGANCGFNMGVRVAVFNRLTLGDNVLISENVTIRDSDNHHIMGGSGIVSAPITIGNNVLIGVNATILKGVSIGEGCVVAAGAVVTRSSPPFSLIGGVPARIIRENVRWTR